MSGTPTNFPPQTYSSSYHLNNISEEEKRNEESGKRKIKLGRDNKSEPSILDCFIKTFLLQSHEKDIDVTDFWKSRHAPKSSVSSETPKSAFRRWRKSGSLKNSQNSHSAQKKEAEDKKKGDEMSMLKFLAINALDLSAPASDILLKSRNSNWFQLSGHPDSLAPAGPGTVWKKRSGDPGDSERIVYEQVAQDPLVRDIIPRYYREVEYQGEKFIELQDLLSGFQDPYVMDIKMGTRTFLESEVQKTTPRSDLYQKMVAIDPSAPTETEHTLQAVTKLRYMQFRENQSSTCSHGFRIEAMKCRGSRPVTDLKTVKYSEDVTRTMDTFLNGREDIKQRLLNRLNEIRTRIDQSEYFRTHEVVGSSAFIIYDDHKVGAWLIDFAKTNKLPHGETVNHRSPWTLGNHEDGLLYGFDQLINVIESVKTSSSSKNNDSMSSSMTTVTVKS